MNQSSLLARIAFVIFRTTDAKYRIRNKASLKAAELVEPANKALRQIIDDAEYANTHRDDFIDYDGIDEVDEADPVGSNSDSDFDIEKKPNEK